MRFVARLAAATLLIGLIVVAACSKGGGGGNPVTPPPGGGLELNSGNVAPGNTYSHTFPATAGSFPYHCQIHPSMTGSVTVSSSSTTMVAAVSIISMSSGGFSPPSVTIAPGGTVTWTNNHNVTHTVTSN